VEVSYTCQFMLYDDVECTVSFVVNCVVVINLLYIVLLPGIDVEVDVESNGQRRRCRRGMLRGHGGPLWHGMRGGGCGPWSMRGGGGGFGRFGCHPRGRWCGAPQPPAWCHKQPAAGTAAAAAGAAAAAVAAAAAAAAAATAQPPTGAPQPTDPHCDRATNAETGEMASGQYDDTTVNDQSWTLVNDGMADVEGGVEQLHVSAPPDDIQAADIAHAIPGTYTHNSACVHLTHFYAFFTLS